MVPRAGIEPAPPNGDKILSLACLPISPPGHFEESITNTNIRSALGGKEKNTKYYSKTLLFAGLKEPAFRSDGFFADHQS